jgi:TonB family protein
VTDLAQYIAASRYPLFLVQILNRQLSRHPRKKYPRQNLNPKKFRFSLDAGGGLLSVSVKSSSGWEELDEAAMDAVRAAAPFASIPTELGRDELALSMTLRFKLD